jgi:hypothetical protein
MAGIWWPRDTSAAQDAYPELERIQRRAQLGGEHGQELVLGLAEPPTTSWRAFCSRANRSSRSSSASFWLVTSTQARCSRCSLIVLGKEQRSATNAERSSRVDPPARVSFGRSRKEGGNSSLLFLRSKDAVNDTLRPQIADLLDRHKH